MSECYLGIDIGTQSVKTCLFARGGGLIASVSRDQYMDTVQPGWASEKPEEWWRLIRECLAELLPRSGTAARDIKAVGVDAIMHCPVGLDARGELVEQDVQMYCDKRSASTLDEIRRHPERVDTLFRETCNMPGTQWMGLKIRWIRDTHPELYDRTAVYLSAKDYINFRLTGVLATDPSEASGTCLLDVRADRWSLPAIHAVGLDSAKLPPIHPSAAVIGQIHAAAAEQTGLAEGTPVVCGAGDMLCGLLGSGLTEPGYVVDLTGTGSVIAHYSRTPLPNPVLANVRHVLDGWTPFNSLDSSGGALRWFRDVFCTSEVASAKEQGLSPFSVLGKLAAAVPAGSDSILFFPYLQGERGMGSASSRGLFVGMTPGTRLGHMVRAVMEGVAFEHLRTIRAFAADGAVIRRVIHTGGAAQSRIWSQIKADIYGIPVEISAMEESTALGAALLAMKGCGAVDDLGEAARRAYVRGEILQPDPHTRRRYDELFSCYCGIHDAMQEHFVNLSLIR